jgi:putative ABC transport system substrate-binding protein
VRGLTRRRFVQGAGLAGLGLLAGCGWWLGQAAPATKVARVGWLGFNPPPAWPEAFRHGLLAAGYVEGHNITIETRYADGTGERLPTLAAELAALPVDLMITLGERAARAALAATSTIPIVLVGGDPLRSGLVTSLARPGGQLTGLTDIAAQLAGKRLELLKQVVPTLSRVAVLAEPDHPRTASELEETEDAAQALGIRLQLLAIGPAYDPQEVFWAAIKEHADGLVTLGGALRSSIWIVDLASAHRLPAMYPEREFAERGGLMNYGPNRAEQFRRAAYFVDRILKGTKPADLPIEQPREFDFIINLQTAQTLGLTIPQHVLLQATEVIQ